MRVSPIHEIKIVVWHQTKNCDKLEVWREIEKLEDEH